MPNKLQFEVQLDALESDSSPIRLVYIIDGVTSAGAQETALLVARAEGYSVAVVTRIHQPSKAPIP